MTHRFIRIARSLSLVALLTTLVSHGQAWGTEVIPYGVAMVRAVEVWPQTSGSEAVVAILSGGLDFSHPDVGEIIGSQSFVPGVGVDESPASTRFGTHHHGTVGAPDNGIGVVGVAPEAQLLIGRILDDTGFFQVSWAVDAMGWAIEEGADVILLPIASTIDFAELHTAIQDALSNGILVVAHAGNTGDTTLHYPAAYPEVVSVVGIDENRNRMPSSTDGSTVELSAPGANVLSTVPVGSGLGADGVWGGQSHDTNPFEGSVDGTRTGHIYSCGLGFPGDFPYVVSGNIAHVRRGAISFDDKVQSAEAAGAIGVIISNNQPGNFTGSLGETHSVPVVSISMEDGDDLVANDGIAGEISVFSSDYHEFSNTTTAAAHVAGVAALVVSAARELSYEISVEDLRESLQITAEEIGSSFEYGYGLVNAQGAVEYMLSTVGIPGSSSQLNSIRLGHEPNPVRSSARLSFDLPMAVPLHIKVYDIRGRQIDTLVEGIIPAGHHEFSWNCRDGQGRPLSSGLYFARLSAGNHRSTIPMQLIR